MTRDERELFNEKIRGIYAAIDANANINNEHFKTQTEILTRIEAQTTKTNGRVTELEETVHNLELQDKDHVLSCPHGTRIGEIDRDLEEYRMAKRYPKFTAGAIVMVGIGVVLLWLAQMGVI